MFPAKASSPRTDYPSVSTVPGWSSSLFRYSTVLVCMRGVIQRNLSVPRLNLKAATKWRLSVALLSFSAGHRQAPWMIHGRVQGKGFVVVDLVAFLAHGLPRNLLLFPPSFLPLLPLALAAAMATNSADCMWIAASAASSYPLRGRWATRCPPSTSRCQASRQSRLTRTSTDMRPKEPRWRSSAARR